MHRIKDQGQLTELPLPCEYFDMIGGTSTGGYYLTILYSIAECTDVLWF